MFWKYQKYQKYHDIFAWKCMILSWLYRWYISLPILLETAYSRPFLGSSGACFSQMTSSIVLTPKRTVPGRKHVVWAIQRKNQCNGSTWARDEEKNCLQLLCLRVLCAACPIVCPHYTQAPAKASNDCGRSLLSSFYVILKMLNRNDEANMITKSSFIISFNIFITRRMLVIIFFKYGVLPRIQSTEVAYFWSRPDWVARSRWLSPATQST